MRYAILGDVHANIHALDAVLDALAPHSVDAYLCAGDLVGYGPFPNECVDRIARLDPICVAGNHDLMAIGRLDADRCIPLARRSVESTRAVLDERSRAYLESLPPAAEAAGGIVLAHGSLTDPEEYTRSAESAARQLATLDGRVLALGHTHRPWAWWQGGGATPRGGGVVELPTGVPCLLNPGAVGQSREREATPRARALVLDLERWEAEFLAVDYDVEACLDALRERALAPASIHLRPPRTTRRIIRRALGVDARSR